MKCTSNEKKNTQKLSERLKTIIRQLRNKPSSNILKKMTKKNIKRLGSQILKTSRKVDKCQLVKKLAKNIASILDH